MNTGQVMISVAAFMFLGTVLINFNNLVLANNADMSNSHDMIIATSITATYLELAQGMNFDENTISQPANSVADLTPPNDLGPDGELDMTQFDDFDDFDGYSAIKVAEGNNGTYQSDFTVTYVDPEDINFKSMPTFLKRMDVKTWRIDIPVTTDTVRMFTTMAYFKFN